MDVLRIFRLLPALAGAFLFACGGPAAPPREAIKQGTVLVIEAADAKYKSEASRVEAGVITWTYYWKSRVTGTSKSYRGLIVLSSEEENHRRWIELDPKDIDRAFPLEVGRQISFAGEEHAEHEGLVFPVVGTLQVRSRETMTLKGRTYDIFVVDLAIAERRPGGERSFLKTMWYAPEIEVPLRTDYLVDGRVYSMKVVNIIEPGAKNDEDTDEPRGLGTVRL